MEIKEDIVIVGAGMSGLATALGLHRLGLSCLVLEKSEDIRSAGFAFSTWHNVWKALDVLGVGDILRQQLPPLQSLVSIAANAPKASSIEIPAVLSKGESNHEFRCIRRRFLLETLANELPKDAIRFASKVDSIEEFGPYMKLLRLSDGSTIKTRVLIGCDGVNSVVSRWLGLSKPIHTGRYALRGFVDFEKRHEFDPKMILVTGDGVRYGIVPIDETTLYWFLTFVPSSCPDKDVVVNQVKMKQYVLSKLGKVTDQVRSIMEKTRVEDIICFPLTYRNPWEVVRGNFMKNNVCVVGDAFHPMTPDLGQGACSAIEDGIVLARCLGQALLVENEVEGDRDRYYYKRIKTGLEKYVKERRWRAFDLITTSLVIGFVEQSNRVVVKFLRDNFLSSYFTGLRFKKGEFHFGDLK